MNKLVKLSKLMLRCQNWWLPLFLHVLGGPGRPFTLFFRSGLAFRCRNKDDAHVVLDVLLENPYYLEEPPAEDAVVVDIGANIGAFSVFAASRGAKVLAFEPHPGNFNMLRCNHILNSQDGPQVLCIRMAVSAKAGHGRLNLGRNNSVHSLQGEGESIPIETTTLERIFRDHSLPAINFLKMDCEGAEFGILESTPQEYLHRIRRMAVECHGEENRITKLAAYLVQAGFNAEIRKKTIVAWRGNS